MADTAGFFGFDSALPDQVQPWEEDDKCEIDAVNDETFGTGAQTGDWEIDHKKMAVAAGLPSEELEKDNLVQALEDLVVNDNDAGTTYADDPAIVSLQKTPMKMTRGAPITPPGFYSSPQIDKIWGQPAPPTAIQPPPGFSGPPGFARPPGSGDGLRDPREISQIQNSQPLSVEDIERQHFERKSGLDRAPGGIDRAPGGPSSLAPGMPNGSPVDDPAVLMATTGRQQQPNQQQHQHQVGQLHPQHRRMLEQQSHQQNRNRNRNENRNRNNQQRRRDPYANLMSKREREWITSMQLRALEIKNPEVEDYYYVNYMKRLLKKGLQNQKSLVTPPPKETRRNRHNSEKEDKKEEKDKKGENENKEKKPWSEGSLGKPVCSSVHNPRKMIEVITKTEETGLSEERAESELAKMANRKKLFKEIESAYTVLLDLELMVQDELRSFGKEAKKVEELRNLIRPDDQLRLLSLLSIRKGKRLIQRILPHLSTEDSAKILTCFINNLALLIKRDLQDEVLPELYDVLANTINTLEFEKVAEMANRKRHNNLATIARNTFGASMICKLLDRGQILLSQMSIQEFPADARQAWLDLVKTLTRDISAVAITGTLPPLLGVYPALAKALERSRSQKHLISHLNGTRQKPQPGFAY